MEDVFQMFFFHLYGSGDSAKILKGNKQPPFPLHFLLSSSPWIATLSSDGGWSLCEAGSDALLEAWLDSLQGRRTLWSSLGSAKCWNSALLSFLSRSYLLWFGLRVDLDGSGQKRSGFLYAGSVGVFLRVCLLGECDGANNELMNLNCKSLQILGAYLRKRLACLYGATEKEERSWWNPVNIIGRRSLTFP